MSRAAVIPPQSPQTPRGLRLLSQYAIAAGLMTRWLRDGGVASFDNTAPKQQADLLYASIA